MASERRVFIANKGGDLVVVRNPEVIFSLGLRKKMVSSPTVPSVKLCRGSWQPEEDMLIKGSAPASQLAERINRSAKAIHRRRKRLKENP